MANIKGKPLDAEARQALKKLVERDGPAGAARRLRISENTLAKALAGLTIARASRIVISAGLLEGADAA